MSSSVNGVKLINTDIGVTLDADHRFLKVSLGKDPFEVVTKTLSECKNTQQTYDRQIKLFDTVIQFLRAPKVTQDPESESDLVLKKALKVYYFILQNMGDLNTRERRFELASALGAHKEKYLDPRSERLELGRKHADSVSSTKDKLEGKLDLTRKTPQLQGRQQLAKTSSSGVPRDAGHAHLRKSSTAGEAEDINPKSSVPAEASSRQRKSAEFPSKTSLSSDSPTSPRPSKSSSGGPSSKALEALRKKEAASQPFIQGLEPPILIALQGYWRGDKKESLAEILKEQKGCPSYDMLVEIKKVPLMSLALQEECRRLLCTLPEKTNPWAQDLIRHSFNIGYTGEVLSRSDLPTELTQKELADEQLTKKYSLEKFIKQTGAFERVLKGLLSQPIFQPFRTKILTAWQSCRQAITQYNDESAVACCEAFLHKLLNRELDKDGAPQPTLQSASIPRRGIDDIGLVLARILRCFRQDFYFSATAEIRTFFKKTDYQRVEDNYTFFYSIKVDGTVEIDVTSQIKCQTPSLSFDMVITNKLRAHVKKLDSSWSSDLHFTIASVLSHDSSLVIKPGTIPNLLQTTILDPLLKLGFPAEARLVSIQR